MPDVVPRRRLRLAAMLVASRQSLVGRRSGASMAHILHNIDPTGRVVKTFFLSGGGAPQEYYPATRVFMRVTCDPHQVYMRACLVSHRFACVTYTSTCVYISRMPECVGSRGGRPPWETPAFRNPCGSEIIFSSGGRLRRRWAEPGLETPQRAG